MNNQPPTIEQLAKELNERLGYSLRWPYNPLPEEPAGLTTSMLLHALLAMHQGKRVAIIAATYNYATTLSNYLRTWALHTGLGKRNDILTSIPSEYEYRLRGIDAETFIDHHCS